MFLSCLAIHTDCRRHTLQHIANLFVFILFSHKQTDAATHCNTLQHIANLFVFILFSHKQTDAATHCNTLQHIATHCNTLQHIASLFCVFSSWLANHRYCIAKPFFFSFLVCFIFFSQSHRLPLQHIANFCVCVFILFSESHN